MVKILVSEEKLADTIKNAVSNAIFGFKSNFSNIKYYSGLITPDKDTIFVFGSNPEGRHGAGSAKVARNKFGAKQGQGSGLMGNSYGLVTKDLRIPGTRSVSVDDIEKNIAELYEVAKSMPEKKFKIAYRNGRDEKTLNGYSGLEMVKMFLSHPIPNNIYFSDAWKPIFDELALKS